MLSVKNIPGSRANLLLKDGPELSALEILISILEKPAGRRHHEDIDRLVPMLNKIEFFKARNLSLTDLRAVAQCLTHSMFKTGEKIIEYGQYGNTFYIVLEGSVSVLVPITVPKKVVESPENPKEEDKDPDETETILKEVAVLGTGKSFGELALITNKPR